MDILFRHYAMLLQILRLPVARLHFQLQIEPNDVSATYRYYTKRHPRYKVIKNKTLGAALLDLSVFDTRDKYLEHIRGKNWGGFHAKRARARGYAFTEIDRNRYVDEIHAINTSVEQRQGRPMDQHYLEKKHHFDDLKNFKYYGIVNPDGKLMAYANLGLYGNFESFSELMGHRNNDGVMHLLIVEVVCRLIDEGRIQYLMYDTFFGAQPGMQLFKKILGFQPYRAKYSLQ
jgi:hypothetical protein